MCVGNYNNMYNVCLMRWSAAESPVMNTCVRPTGYNPDLTLLHIVKTIRWTLFH